MPPNSLSSDYSKRLEFILRECRSKLKDQFIEITSPGFERSLFLSKEFTDICEKLNVSLNRNKEQVLCLTYMGLTLGYLEKMEASSCTFHFLSMDASELSAWLKKHEFDNLGHEPNRMQEQLRKKGKRVLMSFGWKDMAYILEVLFKEKKPVALIVALYNILNITNSWRECLDKFAETYGFERSDPEVETARMRMLEIFRDKGFEPLVKKMEIV